MLLVARSMDLGMITCISFLCSSYKLPFPPFRSPASSFSFCSLFLKSSNSCVLLFPTPFTSVDSKKIGAEVFEEVRNVMLKENGEDKIIRETN
jgi:hypothetical protein